MHLGLASRAARKRVGGARVLGEAGCGHRTTPSHILSLIMGIPHVSPDNNYAKDRARCPTWTSGSEMCVWVDSVTWTRSAPLEGMTPLSTSAIVRTKDRASTIVTCLKLVRRQTVPVEIVVVDSGSSDGTSNWRGRSATGSSRRFFSRRLDTE